jgi:hypothetical protein
MDQGKVQLGDFAPIFARAGEKVVRDEATACSGKVHIGDFAPAFTR